MSIDGHEQITRALDDINLSLFRGTEAIDRLTLVQTSAAKSLKDIERMIHAFYRRSFPVPIPQGTLTPTVTEEVGTMLTFQVTLPVPAFPVPLGDITHAMFIAVIGGNTVERNIVPGVDIVSGLQGNQNDEVHLSYYYVDDADNKGEPLEYDFVLGDTLPPPKPVGTFGVKVTAETP